MHSPRDGSLDVLFAVQDIEVIGQQAYSGAGDWRRDEGIQGVDVDKRWGKERAGRIESYKR